MLTSQEFRAFLDKYLNGYIANVAIVFGLFQLLSISWRLTKTVWRQCVRPCTRRQGWIYKTYGRKSEIMENSWALVTGGSDGIGLDVCKKLAKEGFNICIVSRTQSKIEDKLKEIAKECRDGDDLFKTLAVVADFGNLHTIQEYKDAILNKVSHLDIGVVVLNAGRLSSGRFSELTDSEVEMQMQINANHVVYTAKILVPQLLQRFKDKQVKAAMIVTGSLSSTVPLPGFTTYAATKIFVNYISKGLHTEFKGQIDTLTFEPGFIVTKMITVIKQKTDYETITSEYAADVMFRDLGVNMQSSGAFKHEFQHWYFAWVPSFIVNYISLKKLGGTMEAMRKKGN